MDYLRKDFIVKILTVTKVNKMEHNFLIEKMLGIEEIGTLSSKKIKIKINLV